MNNQADMNKILSEVSEKAKVVVNRCFLYGYEIEPVKLQYLLILMHGTMLALYNKVFFKQNIYVQEERIFIDETEKFFLQKEITSNRLLKEQFLLPHYEEQIINEILEKYGNVEVATLKELLPLKMLSEVCSEEEASKMVVVPNELIKEVFIYYNFYEYISPRKDENTFRRILKQEYSKK